MRYDPDRFWAWLFRFLLIEIHDRRVKCVKVYRINWWNPLTYLALIVIAPFYLLFGEE